jgi:hypothetical protein
LSVLGFYLYNRHLRELNRSSEHYGDHLRGFAHSLESFQRIEFFA